jgi:hypothetical protein
LPPLNDQTVEDHPIRQPLARFLLHLGHITASICVHETVMKNEHVSVCAGSYAPVEGRSAGKCVRLTVEVVAFLDGVETVRSQV